MEKRKYDSSVARIAGNIASGMVDDLLTVESMSRIAHISVRLARAIVSEVERTDLPASPATETPTEDTPK